MMLGIGISTTLISMSLLYNEFAYCPKEKGRPGEKIEKENSGETVCFRNLVTSGEINIFLSSTNYHLDRGIDAFKSKDYQKAIKLFEQANNADFSDPISRIFWQNAKAHVRDKSLKSKGSKSTIIKLAVVTSVDYYEKAATDVLRGVFDAQYKFNTEQEKDDDKPLIEIVIANDENEPIAAKKTAQTLIKNEEIMGIIGHHSSESTDAAQKIYEPEKIPVISSTSSSSNIKGEQFFRTVKGTDEAAKKYAEHIRNELKSSKIVIFHVKGSEYSENLTKNFEKEFNRLGETIVDKINIGSDFNIEAKINEINEKKEVDTVLIFTSVRTNSVAIEISKQIQKSNVNNLTKIQVLGNMALSEQETITKGGNYIDGIEVVRPCLSLESDYMKESEEKWTQKKAKINWRHATSYDAAQAFIKAIKMVDKSDSVQSKEINRKNILSQLRSPSFSVAGKDTSSGLELKWGKGEDHSNENAKYCLAKIKNGKFEGMDKF
jgi:ABC-type branched-subunit amino acid transport system substrate-binding protein